MTFKEVMNRPKKVKITKAADATKKEWSEIKLEQEVKETPKPKKEKVPEGYVKTNHVGYKKKVSPLGFKLNVDPEK